MANYANLKAAIDNVIKTNGQKEITGEVLNQTLNAMVNSLGAGYQFAGVATPSTNPGTPDQNVFYFATQAGTYSNFSNIVLPDGISILVWNGSWSSSTFSYADGVFDISAYHATGGTLATYADLSAALGTSGANIPEPIRKGGMSVKFVQSSDNKYVQYRYTGTEVSGTPNPFLDTANWEKEGAETCVSLNTTTGEYHLEIGDDTDIQLQDEVEGTAIPFVVSNNGQCLQVGGGRWASGSNWKLYLSNTSITGIKKIRIIGKIRNESANNCVIGFYTGIPNFTSSGTPDTTNFISDIGAESILNKDCYIDRYIDVPDNTVFIYTSYQNDCNIKIYPIAVPIIDNVPTEDSNNLVKSGGVCNAIDVAKTESFNFSGKANKHPNEIEPVVMSNMRLMVGGGRVVDSDYELIMFSYDTAFIKIIGTSQVQGDIALWGIYSTVPELVTDTPDATGLIEDSGETTTTDVQYIETLLQNNNKYVYVSVKKGYSVNGYDAQAIITNFNDLKFPTPREGWIIANGSTFVSESSYATSYKIKIRDSIKGCKLINLISQANSAIQLTGHIYNAQGGHIAQLISPDDNLERYNCFFFDMTIADIIADYPNADTIVITGQSTFKPDIMSPREIRLEERTLKKAVWDNTNWKLTMFEKVLCVGDSVTQGFVCESNGETSPSIYKVESRYSYPTVLGKLLPYWTITNAGLSGISSVDWYANEFPKYDYTEYDLVLLELGYNGGLSDNISTQGTQSYAYRQIVAGIVAANPNIKIGLIIPSCSQYSDSYLTTINSVKNEFSQCFVIDIRDYKASHYFNLGARKYHGYDGTVWDYVHFNRIGYAAKAGFIYNRLIEIL